VEEIEELRMERNQLWDQVAKLQARVAELEAAGAVQVSCQVAINLHFFLLQKGSKFLLLSSRHFSL
jgi:prefoldin subunit 5